MLFLNMLKQNALKTFSFEASFESVEMGVNRIFIVAPFVWICGCICAHTCMHVLCFSREVHEPLYRLWWQHFQKLGLLCKILYPWDLFYRHSLLGLVARHKYHDNSKYYVIFCLSLTIISQCHVIWESEEAMWLV